MNSDDEDSKNPKVPKITPKGDQKQKTRAGADSNVFQVDISMDDNKQPLKDPIKCQNVNCQAILNHISQVKDGMWKCEFCSQ